MVILTILTTSHRPLRCLTFPPQIVIQTSLTSIRDHIREKIERFCLKILSIFRRKQPREEDIVILPGGYEVIGQVPLFPVHSRHVEILFYLCSPRGKQAGRGPRNFGKVRDHFLHQNVKWFRTQDDDGHVVPDVMASLPIER